MSEKGRDVCSSGEGDIGLSFSGDEDLIVFDAVRTGRKKRKGDASST